jgi:hypothetical protein
MIEYRAFIEAFLDFDETTRSNEGLDEEKFKKVCGLLYDLKSQFQQDGTVPLDVANIFVDLYSSIESSAYRHNEEMKQKILYSADQLACIARDVTSR